MEKFSYLKAINAGYIDELLAKYQADPDLVDSSWKYFFEGMELGNEGASLQNGHAADSSEQAQGAAFETRVVLLIHAYRALGKLIADIDPLTPPPTTHPLLELTRFGLTQADLDKTFSAGRLVGIGDAKLSEILTALKQAYCRTIAAEYDHIQDPETRNWLEKKMESSRNRESLDLETRKFILRRLTESETFERFLHTRYVAQKRFSVEGAESVIPALDCFIETGAELGAKEFVLGMAHRGRLNVLANVMGKKLEMILTEFEAGYKVDVTHGEGDVKYHKGYSNDFTTRGGKQVHLSLAANPSHLEFVNAVVEGVAHSKQDRLKDKAQAQSQIIPILIHGDAAFAGQGVCYEVLNLSQLEGYGTGGTVHIVINNQVGFTTSPKDSRSTSYCTDLAKMLQSPIFHVNGDDPEAVWSVSKLCAEYRQKFKADVFIDLVCYRKHGHNEGDEPTFTQPLLYKKIKNHASTRELYAKNLATAGLLPEAESQAMVDQFMAKMTEAQQKTRAEVPQPHVSAFEGAWKNLIAPADEDLFVPIKTSVDEKTLQQLAARINKIPEGFHLHPKLGRFFDARLKAVQEGKGIDWGNGESLAYATLVNDGYRVRLSGQDAERGTFNHRHSVLNDFETGETYTPLGHISEKQAPFEVYNSHLSETAVLGFEYGYSVADPQTLVIWEAQFGDFANGAQVIIDQFIATSESKWQRMSAITLLLPHSYEGQGPEHSSARLERFLTLCGKNNLIVCNLTTPAQLFHGLRRQMLRNFRKPLVIMSPKSVLRHPHAVSTSDDFTRRAFEEVLDDAEIQAQGEPKRVLLCSGKVFYDLQAERANRKIQDVAILRLEQLYPWPEWKLSQILKRYTQAKDLVWVQEEPRNMGAWPFVSGIWNGGLGSFKDLVDGRPIRYVGREIGAAPAVGSIKLHEQEQKSLLEKAYEAK